MSNITAFTQNCGSEVDVQLIDDTFANAVNSSITLRCNGAGPVTQTAPPFTYCSDLSTQYAPWGTLCIGGVDEQHACADADCRGCGPSSCSGVDWTNRIASPCSGSILSIVQVQQNGIIPLCCNGSGCIVTDNGAYSCDATHSLLFCILDGGGSAECINTSNNAICSGNTTSFDVSPTSTGSVPFFGLPSETAGTGTSGSSGGSSGSTSGGSSGSAVNIQSTSSSTLSSAAISSSFSSALQQSSNTDSSSGSGLSASDKATIAGSVVGGVASIVAIIGGIWQIRKYYSKRGGKQAQQMQRKGFKTKQTLGRKKKLAM